MKNNVIHEGFKGKADEVGNQGSELKTDKQAGYAQDYFSSRETSLEQFSPFMFLLTANQQPLIPHIKVEDLRSLLSL